ncbi:MULTISPECIES: CDP-alcohol phosphatidyltransferase family protein [Bacillaceae]|uniref:CDP-alcohol phosphatidyltransferase family protein n=1 Tax=Bacillaceae TaxID=186817 RepID=UPI001C5A19B0|nr:MULTISPECIES: CDP-alcohol phosphatidyltransferase family protein [Rossellomorea]MBW3111288.1 CDP-alcohol phosphatidyltransferase family protein [Bacillus sp. MCCB 382]MDX8345932.1 CDP-alcohol phosphatidyltransferase family protein [Rossellomorea sp. YZS02]
MLDTHARKWVQPSIEGTARLFLKKGLSADQVTVTAFVVGSVTGLVYYMGFPIIAVILLWLSGFLDAVDGTMARLTKPSPFGTVMDVTFDRIVEISVILGVAFLHPEIMWALLLLSVSIIVSMTIFLTVGAVSEKQGMKSFYYQAGLAERTEGFILFSVMMLFPSIVLWTTLLFFAVELYTGIQRFLEAKRLLS